MPARPQERGASRAAHAFARLFACALLLASCGREPEHDPNRRAPALLIDGAALVRLLERARTLEATPAARVATQLLDRLADCPEVAAHFAALPAKSPSPASSGALLDRLACRESAALAPPLASHLEEARGSHAGILQWPVGAAGRLALRFDVDGQGSLALAGELESAAELGALGLFVPAATAPAPALIDADESLIHLHLRPAAGLSLSDWIEEGSQGDRLFALKGRLLEGALLEGTLELAFVAPAPGGRVPLALLALHHRARAPVETALAEALAQLEATWAIRAVATRFATAGGAVLEGGCYADLPLLPELAPCWVVTPEALLVGYRAEALAAALHADVPAQTERAPSPASALVVAFDRIRGVDEASARAALMAGSAAGPGPRGGEAPGGAWSKGLASRYARLALSGQGDDAGGARFEASLVARP